MRWVQLCGLVQPRVAPVIAPLSGDPCVLYRVELARLQRLLELGRGSRGEIRGARFVLRLDNGQRVLIDPRHARLDWASRRFLIFRDRDPQRRQRLALLYRRLGRRGPGQRVRGREWLLHEGQPLSVAGWLTEVPDIRGQGDGYRHSPHLALLLATGARLRHASHRR